MKPEQSASATAGLTITNATDAANGGWLHAVLEHNERMKTLTEGQKYELENFEAKDQPGQVIQFIEKKPDLEKGNGVLFTVNDGTTNEEVLRVLIDRMNSMQAKFPCRENAIVTTHLETALLWLEKRTADRKARGVEGKHLK